MTTQPNSVIRIPADNLYYLCGQQVSVKFGKDEKQLFCVCLGVSTGQFILTQTPIAPDIDQKLTPGNPVVVRFVESGKVCGFKSRIRQTITTPFRLVFFDYPDSLELLNLRASKRVPIFIDASIEVSGKYYEGSIRNLSEGGCYFVTEYWKSTPLTTLAVNDFILISFTLLNSNTEISLRCRPVKVDYDKEEIRMGIAFENNPPQLIEKISGFVEYVSQLLGVQSSPYGLSVKSG